MSFIHLLKPIECTPRLNPNVNDRLWMTMMCDVASSFITNLPLQCVGVDRGHAVHMLVQEVHRNSVLSTQFCYEPKTTLKNKNQLK